MPEPKKRTLRERLASLLGADALLDLLRFRGAAEESVSDADLRGSLDRALFAEEPGYLGIDAVFPAETLVVYATAPDQKVALYRRSYTLSEDGTVSLADTKEAVEPVTRYEPVGAVAASTPPEPVAACGCQKPTNPSAESAKEEAMSKLAERVKALIAKSKGRYAEDDSEWLSKIPEDRFVALEAGVDEAPPVETPKPEPVKDENDEDETPKVETVAIPAEELAGLRRMAAKEQAREKARHAQLVAALSKAQKRHAEPKLKAMSLEQLEDMAALLEIEAPAAADYTGRGMPALEGAEGMSFDPPDTYGLRAARERKAKEKEAN